MYTDTCESLGKITDFTNCKILTNFTLKISVKFLDRGSEEPHNVQF